MVRVFFKRFKNILPFKQLVNHWHFLFLGVIIAIAIANNFHWWLLIVGLLYLGWLITKSKRIGKIYLVILTIVLVNWLVRIKLLETPNLFTLEEEVVIINYRAGSDTKSAQVVFRCQGYHYQGYLDDNIKKAFKPGDCVMITASLTEVALSHSEGLFNYPDYLQKQSIKATYQITKMNYKFHRFNYREIHWHLQTYFDQYFSPSSAAFLKTLTIGDTKALDSSEKAIFSSLGLSHLFVISGAHVSILLGIIRKIMQLLKIKETYQPYIGVVFLAIYLIITLFQVSIVRVFLVELIRLLNKKKGWQLTSLDTLALSALIIALINPLLVVSLSFILSYLVTFGLVIARAVFLNKSNYFKSLIIIASLSIFLTLPIVNNLNGAVNLLSVVFNTLYVPIVSYGLLPLTLIVAFIPPLDVIYAPVMQTFLQISNYFENWHFLTISWPHFTPFVLLLYYGSGRSLLSVLEQPKLLTRKLLVILSFCVLLTLWYLKPVIANESAIYFFDLPVGEATFIHLKHDQLNILIDTGENIGEDLETFLQKLGIHRLDYLIITHSDSDHAGKLAIMLENFKVTNLLVNAYDDQVLAPYFDRGLVKNITYLRAGDTIKNALFQLECLSPITNLRDSNNNSLVFYLRVMGLKLLMVGDIEAKAEVLLLERYSTLECDILKVAHHGSNTSTTPAFVQSLTYKMAIIMNGYRNSFDFPNPIVLERLKSQLTFVTSETQTIKIAFLSSNKYQVTFANQKKKYNWQPA